VRVDPTTQAASAEDERRLVDRSAASRPSFDRQPCEVAALADLDLDYIRSQYFPHAIASDVLAANGRPIEQQLRSLRLLAGNRPTWGALLAFGIDPQHWLPTAYVQWLRVDGLEPSDVIRDSKVLTGKLTDVLRRLDELLELNIVTRGNFGGAGVQTSQRDYPITALTQLTRNAIMHRDYERASSPVRVTWYTDRIEIRSPGGLHGTLTPRSFDQGETSYRNPLIAEIMHHTGFAQRFGFGVALARSELAKNGNPPPDFTFESAFLGVTVRRAQ
jgi:ATP-dependent DNA helicase RecG